MCLLFVKKVFLLCSNSLYLFIQIQKGHYRLYRGGQYYLVASTTDLSPVTVKALSQRIDRVHLFIGGHQTHNLIVVIATLNIEMM